MDDWFHHWFDEDYAALYAHRDAAEARLAVETALREAPELGSGPVLDLACGAGRHLVELRKTNASALGVDLSPVLLGLAPESVKPALLRADMRRLPLRAQSLSGITMWFTPFGYFNDAENEALLHDLRDLLRPGGVLVVDYLNAAQLRATLVLEDVIERAGIRVRSRRRLENGRIIKEMELLRIESGETRHAVERVRIYEPEELTDLATHAGLRLRRALGDYAGDVFHHESPRWIGIFEKS